MNEKEALPSFKTKKQSFDKQIQESNKAIIQLLSKQQDEEKWTLDNVNARAEEIKKAYAEHVLKSCTFDETPVNLQKMIQEQPEEIENVFQDIQNLFDKEAKEIEQKKENLKYQRHVPFTTSKIKGAIPFDEIKKVFLNNNPITYKSYYEFIGITNEEKINLGGCENIQNESTSPVKKESTSPVKKTSNPKKNKNYEESLIPQKNQDILQKKHVIMHQQIKNQIIINDHLKNIENHLHKIDLGTKIDELAQKFQNLTNMHRQENENESLSILTKNYLEYQNEIEQLKNKTNLLIKQQPHDFNFSEDFKALEEARNLCQIRLSEIILNKLKKLTTSLNDDSSATNVNDINQQYNVIIENQSILAFIANDENIEKASEQLKIKLNTATNKRDSIEKEASSEVQNINSSSTVDYDSILNTVKGLLNSEDWKIKKRVTLFASKPTTVRKMLTIIKDTELNGAEDTLSALKHFLNNRPLKRWLTNDHAQAFYPKLKNILNDLDDKGSELDSLKDIFQTKM